MKNIELIVEAATLKSTEILEIKSVIVNIFL